MAAGTQTSGRDQVAQRQKVRYQVQAPLDVTVLRRGLPQTLPGRSLNLCERGIAAVLAGEVSPGESVGVELQLPLAASPLRTRALVRHHDRLRCGMEFVGLTPEQEMFLRQWMEISKAEPVTAIAERALNPAERVPENQNAEHSTLGQSRRSRRWILLLALAAGLLSVSWWRWNQGWQELESSLGIEKPATEQPQLQVPVEVMEKLIIHRVDPEYPDAARKTKLEGIVILDVVIGRNGSVASMHAVSGPDVLSHAAMDALRWWRFEPYRVDGKPVAVETKVAVEFHP